MAARRSLTQTERLLAAEPRNLEALFAQACLLDQLGDEDKARWAYVGVLTQDAAHAGALTRLGKLLASTGYTSAALTVLHQGVAAHPGDVTLRVLLGNVLRLAGQKEQAQAQYAAALRLAPGFAPAHQGLSYLLDGVDDTAAEHHRRLGFSGHALSTSDYRGEAPPVEVLRLVSARGGNVDLNGILDDRIFRTHTLVAEFATPGMALPAHAVTFNAIGDADIGAAALAKAEALLASESAPVLNPPDKVRPTGRLTMSARLAAIEGLKTARMARVSRAALQGGLPGVFGFPVLLRSPGYHTGEHFAWVNNGAELADMLPELPGEALLVIECLDTRSVDGAFRKYRAMLIGGEILPLHLAISTEWKVHYFTAAMAEEPAYRAEEARFLADMAEVVGKPAMACLARVGAMLGLDYGGVDFGLGRDGRLLVFEANATMVIAKPPIEAMWEYRLPAAERCLRAAQALIKGKAKDKT